MSNTSQDFRIGFGIDRHQLVAELPLVIGGIIIPSDKGAKGHSDADVLIHAICDALLGALALRDIGFHFPDTDPAFKDADSALFLSKSYDLVKEQGYVLGNIDSTVMLEAPKLNPHIPEMQEKLSQILGLDVSQISIKATRGEAVGPVGEGLAVQAYATVLLSKS